VHIVQELTLTSAINLGVKDFSDFLLDLSIDFEWRRQRLNLIGDCVRHSRFKHRDVEYRVNHAHRVRES